MHCNACGATLFESGGSLLFCPSCGASLGGGTTARALGDADGDGIPDALQQGGSSAPIATTGLEHVPPAPRAPSSRARSLVYAYRGSQGARLAIGIVFFVVGSLFTAIFARGTLDDLLLAAMGQETSATTLDVSSDRSVRVNGAHPKVIRFRFTYEGETYEASSSTLDFGLAKRFAAGTSVRVEVLPAVPSVARVVGTSCAEMGYAGLFVMVFPLLGAIFAIGAWRSNRREIRAFSRGAAAWANVTFQGPDRTTKINGRHPHVIRWALTVDGKTYQGSISSMNRADLDGLVVAGQVVALYDPANPAINTVYVG